MRFIFEEKYFCMSEMKKIENNENINLLFPYNKKNIFPSCTKTKGKNKFPSIE